MKRTRAMPQALDGFTVIELIVVIAVLGVLAGIAGVSFRTPTPVVFANSVQTMLLQARFEAVRLNVPIVVAWSDDDLRFETRRANLSGSGWCENLAGAPLSVTDPSDFGRLLVDTDIKLVWIPSGQARTCSNGLFQEVFAFISDDRRTSTIEVSFGGRVEVR